MKADPYGRPQPVHAHGTGRIDRWTNSTRRIMKAMLEVFDRIIDPCLLVRRVTVVAANLIHESAIPEDAPEQLSLFVDYSEREKQREQEKKADERERKLQQVTLLLQAKYGKNAVVKGMNLEEGATTILRNGQIGGHRAGDDAAAPGRRERKQQAKGQSRTGRKDEQ